MYNKQIKRLPFSKIKELENKGYVPAKDELIIIAHNGKSIVGDGVHTLHDIRTGIVSFENNTDETTGTTTA